MTYSENTVINNEVDANNKAVARKLRALRVGACIRLDEFAEALGVETKELEAYENFQEEIPASVIALACALSGVAYEYFFTENEEVMAEDEVQPAFIAHISAVEEQAVFLN